MPGATRRHMGIAQMLASRAMTTRVVMYETPRCPYCRRARALLEAKGVAAEIVDMTGDSERRAWLRQVTGQRTVPQIFIDGRSMGGCDELYDLEARGKLDGPLAGKSVPTAEFAGIAAGNSGRG